MINVFLVIVDVFLTMKIKNKYSLFFIPTVAWFVRANSDDNLLIYENLLIYFFSSPPTLGLKKNSRKSTNKKNLAIFMTYLLNRNISLLRTQNICFDTRYWK